MLTAKIRIFNESIYSLALIRVYLLNRINNFKCDKYTKDL